MYVTTIHHCQVRKFTQLVSGLLALVILSISIAKAQLKPAGVFGNNAIFQQEAPVPVWGNAIPGASVAVSFGNNTVTAIADSMGKWMGYLPAMKADGKSYQLKIKSGKEKIVFNNILLGEVWLASGQSNMAHKVGTELVNQVTEIQNAKYPDIRFRLIDNITSIVPLNDIQQKDWINCTPQNVVDFSAVAYFFARSLHLDQKIPVGIIVSSRGATSIESWMSKERLITHPDFLETLAKRDEDSAHWNAFVNKSLQAERDRESIAKTSFDGLKKGVTTMQFDDADWSKTEFPLSATKMGYGSYWGLIWVRKVFELSAEQSNKSWNLTLPVKDQNDIVYLNEKEIARDVSKLKNKSIIIPHGQLKPGKNILAIRVYANWGIADIGDRTANCYFQSPDGEKVDLSGFWSHSNKVEPDVAGWQDYYNRYTVNFNGMINPLIPYSIKGFLWYQGENNASKSMQYAELQPMLIDDWRVRWRQGYIPFLFVQLANYKSRSVNPVAKDDWAQFRDAQRSTLFRSPNTAMACIIDIGDEFNIHPANKQDVGIRLYRAAQEKVYHQLVIGSGPIFKAAKMEGNKVRLSFTHAQNGLITKGDFPPKSFALEDETGKWFWANAVIEGQDILVISKELQHPVRIQYAWQSNPEAPIYNAAGLPMVPFNEKIDH